MKLKEITKQGWYWIRYPLIKTERAELFHVRCVFVAIDMCEEIVAFHGDKPMHRKHTDAGEFVGPIEMPSKEQFQIAGESGNA